MNTDVQKQSPLGEKSRDESWRDVSWAIAYTGMSKSWIYQMCAAGLMPHYKMGRSLRFKKREIDEWLKKNGGPEGLKGKVPSCR